MSSEIDYKLHANYHINCCAEALRNKQPFTMVWSSDKKTLFNEDRLPKTEPKVKRSRPPASHFSLEWF